MPILGFNTQSLGFSFILLCYTTTFGTTYYGVLPQRIISFTCQEQQLVNATIRCDDTIVSELSTKRIAYTSIAYSGVCFLTNGPLSRFADMTSNRKKVLLFILFGLAFDQISQIFTTTYLQLVIFHTISGLAGNLYITLALLFSFIADTSNNTPNATPEDVQAQRRKDYGLAESSTYAGVMLGPFLGGLYYKIGKSYTFPYWISGGMSLVLFLSVLIFCPNDSSNRKMTTKDKTIVTNVESANDSLLVNVIDDDDHHHDDAVAAHSTPFSCCHCWWNPFAPFILLFCRRERLLWSSVLLMAWMGQKGVDFLYNPFVRFEFNKVATVQ